MDLPFAHINLANARSANLELSKYLVRHKFLFVSVNEPYFYNYSMTYIPCDYRVVSTSDEPKAAIILYKELKYNIVYCTSCIICVKLFLNDSNNFMYIYSVYASPSVDLTPTLNELRNVVGKYSDRDYVILGDFNAKATNWGSPFTNHRGYELLDFINFFDLEILNDADSIPTCSSSRGISWIDVVLVNNLSKFVWEVVITDDITNSDHNMITGMLYNIKLDFVSHKRIDFNKCDNFVIRSELYKLLNDVDFNCDRNVFECNLSSLQEKLFKLVEYVSDNYGKIQSKYNNAWWTPDLRKQKSKVRAMRRRYQKEVVDEELRIRYRTVYRENLAIYKRSILRAKRDCFKKYVTSLSVNDIYGRFYNVIKDKGKRDIAVGMVEKDGVVAANSDQAVDWILEYNFPEVQYPTDRWDRNLVNVREVTYFEILSVMSDIKNRKAPGDDGITNELCKLLFKLNPGWYVKVFNYCLNKGIFPKCWKIAKVILIPKEGRDYTSFDAYRPICLLPCLGKVFDKLICRRLVSWLEINKVLSDRQYGFRRGRSAINAVGNIRDKVLEARGKGLVTCIISLDFRNAFNSARWDVIRNLLNLYNIPDDLKIVINDFISDRKYIRSDGTYGNYNVGVPQGSSLGPVLWLLYINELLELDFGADVYLQAFADDVIILLNSKVVYKFEEICKEVLEKVWCWSIRNGLNLNIDKCGFTVIGKKVTRVPPIRLGGSSLSYTEELKYLGIILDRNLSWLPHLDYIREKVASVCGKLVRVSKATWGLSGRVLKKLYLEVIDKIMEYGSEIWFLENSRIRLKIAQVQRIPLLSITKSYRTVSTDALCVIAGIPPAEITIMEKKRLYDFRTYRNNYYLDGEVYRYDDVDWKVPNFNLDNDRRIPWKYGDGIHRNAEIEVYTDGSRTDDDKVGYGFVVFCNDSEWDRISGRIVDYASVFDAEACAIWKGLEYVKENFICGSVNIYSDSRSVLEALASGSSGNYLLTKIRDNYFENNNFDMELYWVKAHVGNKGNEIADVLAKEATNRLEVDLRIKISSRKLKKLIDNYIDRRWQEAWIASDCGRHTFEIFPVISRYRIYSDFCVNQFISGHGVFPAYQNRMHQKNMNCICGCINGDVKHILYDCNKFVGIRETYYPRNYGVLTIRDLLHDKYVLYGMKLIVDHFLKLYLCN